jgi:hypothetical protein
VNEVALSQGPVLGELLWNFNKALQEENGRLKTDIEVLDSPIEVDTTGSNDFEDDEDDDAFMDSPSLSGGTGSSLSSPKKKRYNGGGGGGSNPFPRKLMYMMDKEDSSVVHWLPHGDAFKIRDHEKLVAEILPKYFGHIKFTSFERQLHVYGFRRITKGPDTGAFRHEMFRRNRPDLCAQMKRSKRKSGTPSPKLRFNNFIEFLERGADVSLKHNIGKTAKDWAVEKGHADIIQLLDEVCMLQNQDKYFKFRQASSNVSVNHEA